jgi:hypothetical protein
MHNESQQETIENENNLSSQDQIKLDFYMQMKELDEFL